MSSTLRDMPSAHHIPALPRSTKRSHSHPNSPHSRSHRPSSIPPPSSSREEYPYSTLPALFWVVLVLLFLTCLQSPKHATQFVTTYNTHPSKSDGSVHIFFPPSSDPHIRSSFFNTNIVSVLEVFSADILNFARNCVREFFNSLATLTRTIFDPVFRLPRGGGIIRRVDALALYSEDPSRASIPSSQDQSYESSSPSYHHYQLQQQQQQQQQQPIIPPATFPPAASSSLTFTSDEQSLRLLPGKRVQNLMFGFSFALGVVLILMVFSEVL